MKSTKEIFFQLKKTILQTVHVQFLDKAIMISKLKGMVQLINRRWEHSKQNSSKVGSGDTITMKCQCFSM